MRAPAAPTEPRSSDSLLRITGSVAELEDHRAVGLMATHITPIQTTNDLVRD